MMQTSINNFFKVREDETIYISAPGFERLMARYEGENGGKDVLWTTDYNLELPIRLKKSGCGSETPTTLIQEFERIVTIYPERPAMSVKLDGKWHTTNYRQYFDDCVKFGKSLIGCGLYLSAVNIIGFNAPEWNIAYFGSLFARCLPVGIYTTNSNSSCIYIAQHSECKLVVAEDMELAKKYLPLLETKKIGYIVLYKQKKPIDNNYGGRVLLWNDFFKIGEGISDKILQKRMDQAQPGNCCTLVYTSGTTGMPKGVMLSHDNYVWVKRSSDARKPPNLISNEQQSLVSYLPLSHVAAQLQDTTGSMMEGNHVYFAEPTALQGTLVQTLNEVRPTYFFSVPRVWEKISQKMRQMADSGGYIKTKIGTWAKSIGAKGVTDQLQGNNTSFQYKLAKKLVFNKVKQALGLDRVKQFIFGAAPLSNDIRFYFLTLGIPLNNAYGMSECAGPATITEQTLLFPEKEYMREAGTAYPGTELKIVPLNPGDEQGEIYYRGRHIFMGYYKHPEETAKTIDADGFLHSGDVGRLDKNGVLFITGRVKELLITAAGENIPPVLIQNVIKENIPLVSNVMLIGDGKRFLTALVTLKSQPDGRLMQNLLHQYEKMGSQAKTVEQAKSCPIVFKYIEERIKAANDNAISRAQRVQTFAILGEDFTVENGILTPTLKLKRKEALKRYKDIIESFYTEAKL